MQREKLFADDGDFGGRNFQPHQPVIIVQEKPNLEIHRSYLQTFIGFAVRRG